MRSGYGAKRSPHGMCRVSKGHDASPFVFNQAMSHRITQAAVAFKLNRLSTRESLDNCINDQEKRDDCGDFRSGVFLGTDLASGIKDRTHRKPRHRQLPVSW